MTSNTERSRATPPLKPSPLLPLAASFKYEHLLLRHAKSSWLEPTKTDHERPLNAWARTAALPGVKGGAKKQTINVREVLNGPKPSQPPSHQQNVCESGHWKLRGIIPPTPRDLAFWRAWVGSVRFMREGGENPPWTRRRNGYAALLAEPHFDLLNATVTSRHGKAARSPEAGRPPRIHRLAHLPSARFRERRIPPP
jgi:hypothetical protein